MVLRPGLLLPAFALSLAACSSSNFETPASVDDSGASDAASTEEAGATDSAVDAGPPDPCDPEPGVAKLCVKIEVGEKHPDYTLATGASSLFLDGKGKVFLAAYDQPIKVTGPSKPKSSFLYPEGAAELTLDADLPRTFVEKRLTPGVYSFYAGFADNLSADRGDRSLPGDFVTVPNIVDQKVILPSAELKLGQTAKLSLKIYPMRQLGISYRVPPSAPLLAAATTTKTVHGDGPVLLGLFTDESLSAGTVWKSLELGPCVNLEVGGVSPVTAVAQFASPLTGTFTMFGAVYDYGPSDTELLPQGTLISRQTATGTAPLPKITIDPSSWSSSGTIDLVNIAKGAFSAGTPDPVHCPGG